MKNFLFKYCRSSGTGIANLLALILIAASLCGCSGLCNAGVKKSESKTRVANPASANCANKGGVLSIQKRGDGRGYGICIFEDNRQCEEWALFRGECPVGGRKITGYVTPAAQYCAITGGSYKVTDQSKTDEKQGTCTFNNGKSCDAWEYYSGKCSKDN